MLYTMSLTLFLEAIRRSLDDHGLKNRIEETVAYQPLRRRMQTLKRDEIPMTVKNSGSERFAD
jgi:hypothetical protein